MIDESLIDKDEYQIRRRANSDPAFRKEMLAKLEGGCVNCRSKRNIELHHIVPLKLGGTNNPENIAALCNKCHKAVTFGGHANRYRSHSHDGRKPTCTQEEAFAAYDKWSEGEICTTELKEDLKMGKGSHVKESKWYPEWKRQRGIKDVENRIEITIHPGKKAKQEKDVHEWRAFIHDGSVTSTIYKANGEVLIFRYKSCGDRQ